MIHTLHEIVWGPWLLFVFLGTGIYYTVVFRFFQVRKLKYWLGETLGSMGKGENREEKKRGVSQFQSACTALAATIGTGNIVGVAAALTAGGPGAIFWMWISAAIGMMTAYGETFLGIRFRKRQADGTWLCGPMVTLDRGLRRPALGFLYGVCCIMTSLGMGSMVQANSLAETARYSWNVPSAASGIILIGAVFLITQGGIRKIASVSEKIMPFSAGIYIFFSMAVILSSFSQIPGILAKVFQSAFEPAAAAGGAAGFFVSKSLQYGISRGVFSNEAGLGTLAILHGAAGETTARQQGMWAMAEVFIDTIVICTLTALVILLATDGDPGRTGLEGAALTAFCFSLKMGTAGEWLVSFSMAIFAFATIIAWYYLGRQALAYVTKRLSFGKQYAHILFSALYLNAVFWGCVSGMEAVWEFADVWNGLLAVPNLIALAALRKEVEKPL